MKLQYSLLLSLSLIASALAASADATTSVPTYNELYREGYHFSPPQNWMNDPNGLVYFNGNYHLFYQYNPYAAVWGHMSWGHAISQDLVHWENLPLAIPEYDNIMIFSGSAIIDTKNASGLCNATAMAQGGCMLAFYAANSASGQAQALAYSNDEGLTFTEYPGNPVINENLTNFRDPKVFWYEPEQKWIMATVLADIYKVSLYTSQDLINWTHLSEFGPAGSTAAAWECPDLFPLVVDGSGTQKWVLTTSVAGKVQYFVGDFDGTTFTNENPSNLALFVDQGVDYYAAVTWNDDPQGRRLMIGWLDNWAYAGNVPTDVWRGQFTIVRELNLIPTAQGYRLSVQPVDALTQLRTSPVNYTNIQLNQSQSSMTLDLKGTQLDILIDFVYPSAQAGSVPSEFGISVFVGTNQSTVIGYDVSSQSVYVDRTNSGVTSFSSSFPCRTSQAMAPTNGSIQLRILVDQSSVEVFSNDGTLVMSHIIFPDPSQDAVQVFVIGGSLNVSSVTGYALNSIWNSTSGVVQDTIRSEGFLAIYN